MSFFVLIAGGEEVHNELPMAPWMFGALVLAVFFLLLGVLWSFRNTAHKLGAPGSSDHAHGSAAGAGHH